MEGDRDMSNALPQHMVLKCGTDVLIDGCFDQWYFNAIAEQCRESPVPVTVVSSGAVRAGERRLGYGLDTAGFLTHKELAGVGARHLMNLWGEAFAPLGREVVQVWVTPANLGDIRERHRICEAIRTCHRYGLVPIINENDIISAEWRGMDNDSLALIVAGIVHADALLFLTGVGGVYDKDPMEYPDARRYDKIDVAAACRLMRSLDAGERGGMRHKLRMAIQGATMGMRVAISGLQYNAVRRFAIGEPVETMILPVI